MSDYVHDYTCCLIRLTFYTHMAYWIVSAYCAYMTTGNNARFQVLSVAISTLRCKTRGLDDYEGMCSMFLVKASVFWSSDEGQ